MVVDTVGALCRATDAVWGWITEHIELLGSGLARLLSSPSPPWHLRPGRLQDSSVRPASGYGGGGGHDDLPLGRGTGGAAFGGFSGHNDMDRFSGAVRGLGRMGMSNGGGAPGGTLGIGRFEFDDASPQFPATSDVLHGDSSIASPTLAAATV